MTFSFDFVAGTNDIIGLVKKLGRYIKKKKKNIIESQLLSMIKFINK